MSVDAPAVPLLLNATDAAAYVGYSTKHFLRRVATRRAPAPVTTPRGTRRMWSRLRLEQWTLDGCPPEIGGRKESM